MKGVEIKQGGMTGPVGKCPAVVSKKIKRGRLSASGSPGVLAQVSSYSKTVLFGRTGDSAFT